MFNNGTLNNDDRSESTSPLSRRNLYMLLKTVMSRRRVAAEPTSTCPRTWFGLRRCLGRTTNASRSMTDASPNGVASRWTTSLSRVPLYAA